MDLVGNDLEMRYSYYGEATDLAQRAQHGNMGKQAPKVTTSIFLIFHYIMSWRADLNGRPRTI